MVQRAEEWRIPEIAQHFGTTTAYWYKLLREGKISGRRNERGQWLIAADVVKAWEDKRNAGRVRSASQPTTAPVPPAPALAPPPNHPLRRATDHGVAIPEFRFTLVPFDETASWYREVVEHLALLGAEIAKLKPLV